MPGKRRDRIVDPATHWPRQVCLVVAAEFLGCSPRTLKRRVEKGYITVVHHGNIYNFSVDRLVAYKRYHTEEGIDAA